MSIQQIQQLKKELEQEQKNRIKAQKALANKKAEVKVLNKYLASVLLKNNLNFKELFENIIDYYILTDLCGNILKMNKAAIDFTGYNLIDEAPLNVLNIIHKEDVEFAVSSFYSFINKKDSNTYQLRIYTKSKEVKWIEFKPNVVFNTNGDPQYTQGFFRDITEHKKQSIIFKNQKQELDVIVNNSFLGIVLTNLKGELVRSNLAFQNLIGYTEQELLTKNIKDVSLEEDHTISLKSMSELGSKNIESFSVKIRYITKTGEIIWAKTNVKGVKNNNGIVTHLVAIIEDITKKIKQERELKQLLKELTKSNKELKDFAHVVSHDLKSPLRNMNTLVNWIIEENNQLYIKNSNNFNLLNKNIVKMELLIDGILNYESIDKIERRLKNIDLNILLKNIKTNTYIPSHIELQIINTLPTIKGDIHRLQQLFQNLISNSVKYIDKEKGIIKIKCVSENNFWKFSIQDNGIGILEKYFDKIFEVFQVLENSEDSTGIGLSIVKKIINFYKGEIWLNSTPNVGTIFYFTIPK